LRMGTVIPSILISGVNSDLPGMVLAQVAKDVRDSATGHYILIPQGSKLVGRYDHNLGFGQDRLMLTWQRIQFPNGSILDLSDLPGAGIDGSAGLEDQVDHHLWRTFGQATLLAFVGAGAQLSQHQGQGQQRDAREELAADLGRQWGQVGQQLVRRNLNVQPTIRLRPGLPFSVMVTRDVRFDRQHTNVRMGAHAQGRSHP